MLIGDLSNKTGFSRDTIRFYEKNGLIQVGKKERRENNYKEYSEKTLQRLLMIKRIKKFGFTLSEISDILNLFDADMASCSNYSGKMAEKVELIDQKIAELQQIRAILVKTIGTNYPNCTPDVKDKNCPALVSDILKP